MARTEALRNARNLYRAAGKALDSAAVFQAPDGAARRLRGPRTTLEKKIKSLRINKYRYRFDAREFSSKLG